MRRVLTGLLGRLLGPGAALRALRADGLRLPAPRTFVLSFDVEADEDARALPALAAALDREGVPASFAAVGEVSERLPEAHRALLGGAHEVLLHGGRQHTHPRDGGAVATFFYDRASEAEIVEDVRRGDAALRALGAAPIGFRIPHFATCGRRELAIVDTEILRLGYRYSTSRLASALERRGRRGPLREFPVLPCPDHPNAPFDSWHFWAAPDRCPADAGEAARRLAAAAPAGPVLATAYFDPGEALRRFDDLRRVLEAFRAAGFAFTTYAATLRDGIP